MYKFENFTDGERKSHLTAVETLQNTVTQSEMATKARYLGSGK